MKYGVLCAALAQLVALSAMAADITAPHLNGNVILDGRLEEPM